MKRILLALLVGLLSLGFVASEVQAKRLGGGTSSGMKRQAPPAQPVQPAPRSPDATPGTPAQGAAPPPVTPPRRNWMAPLAGLAAGLGLAALFSHFGMGAEFGSFMTTLLLVGVGVFVLRFLWTRFGAGGAARMARGATGLQPAGAMAGGPGAVPLFGGGGATASPAPVRAEPVFGTPPSQALRPAVPASFDTASFVRIAKLIFIRMQAANDAGNLDDLRQFATPEMFATFRLDLQDRRGAPQQTDVVQLDAQVVDVEQDAERQIVSVRFHGLIREEKDAAPQAFDEVWHLVRPNDGSREWAIAGIAQNGTV